MKNLQQALLKQENPLNIIYASSYIPRKCGIATYTKDLTNAINLLNPHSLAEILSVIRPEDSLEYPWEAKFKIVRDDLSTYLAAAEYVNRSHADLVVLEHEFGLFGGEAGEYIIPFVEKLHRPLITTLHTVLPEPDTKTGEITKRVANASKAIVVMMENVAQALVKKYRIPRKKIVVIPHGVPDISFNDSGTQKRKKRLDDRLVLGNINLLDPNKGIEYALEAVALIAKEYPDVLYLVIGQTHPELLRREGERYRNFLKQRVRELNIAKNVRFINQYLPLPKLLEWLKAIDIYITPYLEPLQATSGALAYAIGAGKACVSTPYVYSQEMLADGRGILVPFRDGPAIGKAVLDLQRNPKKREAMKRKVYLFGRLMTWPSVARTHLTLFRAVINNHLKQPAAISPLLEFVDTRERIRQPFGQH